MKEWILENTEITTDEYDKLININTVSINGKGIKQPIEKLSNHPIVNIALFTTRKPTLKQRRKFKIIKQKDINKKNYYIYQKIKFYILTEFIKHYKSELYTINRHNQCFHLNSFFCLKLNINSYLITALCKSPYIINNPDYLHTFILIHSNDNQEYIIDATLNIIMKKEIYFSIFNPQIITCINKTKLTSDLQLLTPLEQDGKLYKAEYLCFPEQVMTSIKKLSKAKKQ